MNKEGYFHPETENYKYWTQQEEQRLKELVEIGKYSFKEIGNKLNRSGQSCQDHSRIMGLNSKFIRRKYTNDINFWTQPNLLNCYWAGMSAADCNIKKCGVNNSYSYCLSLALSDKCHIEQFKNDIKYDGIISEEHRYKPEPNGSKKIKLYHTATIRINDKKWGEDLEKNFNIVPNKTKRLAPPNLNDDILKLSYYLGYTDGDGCICLVNRKSVNTRELVFRFTSCSFNIINWLKELIDRLFPKELYARRNKTTKISTSENGKYHSFTIIGMRALVLYNYLKDFPVPKMQRKWFRKEVLDFLEENKRLYPQYFNKELPNFSKYLPSAPETPTN